MKILYVLFLSFLMAYATGDPVLKIKLKPIAIGEHGHVLFSTYKYANAFGSNSYDEEEFRWLVVYGRTGEWDERKAFHYDGKDKDNLLYQKYIRGKIGLKNPDNVLKEIMEQYFFTASSTLRQESLVYAIKANQSCFDSKCMERTTIQKTLGEKKSKVFHAPIRSSFYYGGVALFHNTYKHESDMGDPNVKSNTGAVFDFNQEVYRAKDDAYPKLYPYSYVDALVLFDPYAFRINTEINLPEIHKQIDHCNSKKSKHKIFKIKNEKWDICQENKETKIISIEYTQHETRNQMYTEYTELYVVNHGKLEYAFEQHADSRKGHQWIWNCQFAVLGGTEAEVITSLGHGKTEDDNWDSNEIIGMYKKRMLELKKINGWY